MRTPPTLDLPARLAPLEGALAARGGDVVAVAARPSVPLVQLRALLLAPAGDDAGVRRILAATLLRRPGAQAALDAVDATAEVTALPDGLLLSLSAAPGPLERLVATAHAVLRPAADCDADTIESERGRLASEDEVTAQRPDETARRAALRALFGDASRYAEALPAGRPVSGQDLADWLVRSGPVVLSAAGALDPREAGAWGDPAPVHPLGLRTSRVHSALGCGLGSSAETPPVEPPTGGTSWSIADRPGAAQTVLRAVAPVPRRDERTRAAAEVAEHLLGSGRKSALVRELRDQRGFGYHPGSHIVDRVTSSYVLVEVDVATEVTGAALAVVDDILRAAAAAAPDDDRLDAARRGVVGDLARAADGQGTLADLLLDLALAGLGPEALPAHAEAVVGVGPADVRAAAERIVARLHAAAVADVSAVGGQRLPARWTKAFSTM